jgi:deoxycytidylate deaminase
VVRVTNGGDDAMARPCEMCQQVILKSAIRVVYYTNQEGDIVRERMSDDN